MSDVSIQVVEILLDGSIEESNLEVVLEMRILTDPWVD